MSEESPCCVSNVIPRVCMFSVGHQRRGPDQNLPTSNCSPCRSTSSVA
ncbi:hypothetical protein GMOD_00002479 [Pyrenophora seminiperda CCB06]|uniref:Uncharacterized protein n=1 Tax=Pyrenophora seminiperda CCB06 TaxID=1302712 RepID=A0A3M7M2S2_9PLEO|nr:hypothetical protein GMOD_00002479 [Pyrenophora seminiperda CCB06]